MAQKARPSADTYLGNYEDELGGTTSIYQSIDEVSADDADYVASESAPSSSAYVTKLTTLTDPVSSTGHTLYYRYEKSGSGPQVDLVIQLRQAYVSEASQGTLIASDTKTDIPATPTAGSMTLSGVEADAITDYTDLYVRVVYDQP